MPRDGVTRAVIIGGGVGGLSTAIALRQAGVDAVIYERTAQLTEVGAGLQVWSNGIRALQKLGVADAVLAEGMPLTRVENRTWKGELMNTIPIDEMDRKLGGQSIAIHRGKLQTALAGALEPGIIQLDSRCTGFSQDATSITAQLADGRTDRGDVLVGADGLRSTVRAQRFGAAEPEYQGFTVWRGVAQYEHDAFPPGVVLQVRGPSAVFGISALTGGSVYWFGSARAPAGQQDPPGERKNRVLQEFGNWYEAVTAAINATDEPAIIRTDIYDRSPIKSWGEGRMTLLGDAAHPTVPSLGQGACMAIEDAATLGRLLQSSNDASAALRQYEAARIPRTTGLVRLARRMAWIDHWEAPPARAARDTAFRLLPSRALAGRLESVMAYNV